MRGADVLDDVKFKRGKFNKITDVSGVRVGHSTVVSENPHIRTGITVVIPHGGCVYRDRVFAARFVLNGYGKATGFVQIDETGLLETPIVLTGTMNVGKMWDCTLEYILERSEGARSVNPVVLECNDTRMGESEKRIINCENFKEAVKDAKEDFKLGCIGAGVGMVTFGYKSGIGSSSRVVKDHIVGVLAMPNFGNREDLGSVILVLATDAPLIPNQLRRLAVRASLAIPKIGGKVRHRSGDMIFAFSTALKIPRSGKVQAVYIPDDSEDFQELLDASIEAAYESIVDSLVNGCNMTGRDGKLYKKIDAEELSKKLNF